MPRKTRPKIIITGPADAATAAVDLRTLRDALGVTKSREAAVTKALKEWLEDEKLDRLDIEGHPSVRLRGSDTYTYDVARIAQEDPDLLLELALAGCLSLSISALRDAVSDGRIQKGTRQYRTARTSFSLVFEENEDA